jgi:hypothetical protein
MFDLWKGMDKMMTEEDLNRYNGKIKQKFDRQTYADTVAVVCMLAIGVLCIIGVVIGVFEK